MFYFGSNKKRILKYELISEISSLKEMSTTKSKQILAKIGNTSDAFLGLNYLIQMAMEYVNRKKFKDNSSNEYYIWLIKSNLLWDIIILEKQVIFLKKVIQTYKSKVESLFVVMESGNYTNLTYTIKALNSYSKLSDKLIKGVGKLIQKRSKQMQLYNKIKKLNNNDDGYYDNQISMLHRTLDSIIKEEKGEITTLLTKCIIIDAAIQGVGKENEYYRSQLRANLIFDKMVKTPTKNMLN